MTTSPKRKWNSDRAQATTVMLAALTACDQFLDSISNSYEVCHHTQALIDQVKAAITKAGAA